MIDLYYTVKAIRKMSIYWLSLFSLAIMRRKNRHTRKKTKEKKKKKMNEIALVSAKFKVHIDTWNWMTQASFCKAKKKRYLNICFVVVAAVGYDSIKWIFFFTLAKCLILKCNGKEWNGKKKKRIVNTHTCFQLDSGTYSLDRETHLNLFLLLSPVAVITELCVWRWRYFN